MILSDEGIIERVDRGSLVIEPFEESNVEPASVDLRLGRSFKKPVATGQIIDTRGGASQEYRNFEADAIILEPEESILAETIERDGGVRRPRISRHDYAGDDERQPESCETSSG